MCRTLQRYNERNVCFLWLFYYTKVIISEWKKSLCVYVHFIFPKLSFQNKRNVCVLCLFYYSKVIVSKWKKCLCFMFISLLQGYCFRLKVMFVFYVYFIIPRLLFQIESNVCVLCSFHYSRVFASEWKKCLCVYVHFIIPKLWCFRVKEMFVFYVQFIIPTLLFHDERNVCVLCSFHYSNVIVSQWKKCLCFNSILPFQYYRCGITNVGGFPWVLLFLRKQLNVWWVEFTLNMTEKVMINEILRNNLTINTPFVTSC